MMRASDMSHQRFGEIRSLLHQHEPSAELWHRLTQLLWGWRNHLPEEMMASYCNGVLSDWPDMLRTLPKAWLKAILRGENPPIASICRHVPLGNKQITPEKLASLCSASHLASITRLDLSSNRLASRFKEIGWLDTLATAPFLCSLTHLRLGSCWLDETALARLATIEMPSLRLLDLSSNLKLSALPHFSARFFGSATIEVLELGWNLTSEAANRRYDYYREGPELYTDYLRPRHLVEALPHFPALKELNLYRSSCEPDFILDHEALFSRLDTLHIGADFANAEWVEAIEKSLALRSIRALHLSRLTSELIGPTIDALIEMKQTPGCKLSVLGLPFAGINHLDAHPEKRERLGELEIVQVE